MAGSHWIDLKCGACGAGNAFTRDHAQEVLGTERFISMLLWCPSCGERHIDAGEFATKSHHTHACQHCGMVWRPALVATRGVRFLPGFKNDDETERAPGAGERGTP